MKSILAFTLILQCFFASFASAAIQITSFGQPHGIVADNNEWTCQVLDHKINSNLIFSQNAGALKYISGKAKNLPLIFDFFAYSHLFSQTQTGVLNGTTKLLSAYAMRMNTIISNVQIKGESKTHYVVTASFFDNISSGHIALYIMPNYVMFVQLRTELFDEVLRNTIFDKPFALITPLYNPKKIAEIAGVDFDDFFECVIVDEQTPLSEIQ